MSKKLSRGSARSAPKRPARKQHRKPPQRADARSSRKPAAPHDPLFRAFLAVSLDGFIADKSGGVDWLNPYFSPEIDFAGFMRSIGITVYGRTTYDWAVAHGHLQASAKNRVILLTRRPPPTTPAGVEVYSGDIPALADRLRAELRGTGKDIWLMGGGISIAAFHATGLVDRWELGIVPILLGEGIPLIPAHSRGHEPLRLTHGRTLKNGMIEAHYEPLRSR
jgi:dihydrofolate reductase